MLEVTVERDEIRIGERFSFAVERTLRIPEDGRTYPLPPGLGRLPVSRAADYPGRVPAAWLAGGDLFVPLYQREALWLALDGAPWKPNAVQVGLGGVDAVSAGRWGADLQADPQNYLVVPEQLWLDGVNAGDGFVRQFVATPLGEGRTVEAQVTGREAVGGLQIRVFEPRPGRFPDAPPPGDELALSAESVVVMQTGRLGIGAGGQIRQRIVVDPYGLEAWDPENHASVRVQIVNSEQYRELTGRDPPPTPVSAATYTERGLPWFELYDEGSRDVPAPDPFASLRGATGDDREEGFEVDPGQIRPVEPGGGR